MNKKLTNNLNEEIWQKNCGDKEWEPNINAEYINHPLMSKCLNKRKQYKCPFNSEHLVKGKVWDKHLIHCEDRVKY